MLSSNTVHLFKSSITSFVVCSIILKHPKVLSCVKSYSFNAIFLTTHLTWFEIFDTVPSNCSEISLNETVLSNCVL